MKSISLSIVCALFLLGSCRDNAPKEEPPAEDLTLGKVQGEIRVGLSSAEVIEVLGSPNIVTTDDQRREVWVYDKISTERMNAGTSSYGTLILFGGQSEESRSSSRQRTLTILIKFDAEKKVRDFAYNYTQF